MRGILISTPIPAYMSVLMRGILINTLIQTYMSVLMRGILISTPIQAYMSVLIRGILISMGVPGEGGEGGGSPTQFVGQTKPVGQYSLHSRAILAYYKNKWDKFCQFCSKYAI